VKFDLELSNSGAQAPDDEVVSRALPLIELLEASAKAECNVMWDKN
jgi:hypothetical protein